MPRSLASPVQLGGRIVSIATHFAPLPGQPDDLIAYNDGTRVLWSRGMGSVPAEADQQTSPGELTDPGRSPAADTAAAARPGPPSASATSCSSAAWPSRSAPRTPSSSTSPPLNSTPDSGLATHGRDRPAPWGDSQPAGRGRSRPGPRRPPPPRPAGPGPHPGGRGSPTLPRSAPPLYRGAEGRRRRVARRPAPDAAGTRPTRCRPGGPTAPAARDCGTGLRACW